MGKIFITDEVNDTYTADVTNARKLKIEDGASNFSILSSAHTTVSGQAVMDGGCYLTALVLGESPTTATMINIFDTYASAGGISGFGTSGANVAFRLAFEPSAGAVSGDRNLFPRTIPLGVYMASGITVSLGASAVDAAGRIGCAKNVTVIYS